MIDRVVSKSALIYHVHSMKRGAIWHPIFVRIAIDNR